MDQVDERLLNLDLVPRNPREIDRQFRFNDDAVITKFVGEHAEHLSDNLVDIHRCFDRCGLLEEGTNSPHDFGRGMPVPDNPLERRLRPLEIRRIVRQPRLTCVRIGHDGRQWLVDFMSNGRGELCNRCDLHGSGQLSPGAAQRFLHLPVVVDVNAH